MPEIAIQTTKDEVMGEFLVISAYQISCDDLVRIGKFLGVVEEKNK